MDLQLHTSKKSFSAKASEFVNDLELLEKKAIGWGAGGNRREREELEKEVERISPSLGHLRLDCLCLSLSTGFQNQSAEMFQALERLNRLADLLQGVTFEQERSTAPVSTNASEENTALQKAIVDARRQLDRIASNPM